MKEVRTRRSIVIGAPVDRVRRRLVGGTAASLLAASAGFGRYSLAAPPGRKWLIGVLLFEEPDRGRETRLRESLAALGYVEGRNTRYEIRYWARDDARLAALAAELVALKPDVLVTVGTVTTRALARATSTIPIVTSLTDPAEVGIARIGQPGGNITGLSVAYRETATKAIEYLKAMAPDLKRLAFPVPGGDSHTRSLADTWEACARSLGVELHRIDPGPQGELKPILASLRQKGVRAMVSTLWRPEPRNRAERQQEAAVYVAHQIATLTTQVEDVRDGLLLCFRGDPPDSRRGMATILDRILRGTPVGDIPFELPSKYTLAVNRGTASALGLAIAPELLVRASVVYE